MLKIEDGITNFKRVREPASVEKRPWLCARKDYTIRRKFPASLVPITNTVAPSLTFEIISACLFGLGDFREFEGEERSGTGQMPIFDTVAECTYVCICIYINNKSVDGIPRTHFDEVVGIAGDVKVGRRFCGQALYAENIPTLLCLTTKIREDIRTFIFMTFNR